MSTELKKSMESLIRQELDPEDKKSIIDAISYINVENYIMCRACFSEVWMNRNEYEFKIKKRINKIHEKIKKYDTTRVVTPLPDSF